MRQVLLVALMVTSLCSYGQEANSLKLNRTFNSEEELHKINPETVRSEILIDSKTIKIKERGILNREIKRVDIPSNINSFVFSPSREYFVAFEETEGRSSFLFFYKSDGNFITKQPLNIYPNVKFSGDGQYVIAFNSFGREILVFSKTGQRIFSGDYIELIKDKTKVLYNVLISENCKEVLINAGEDIHLIDLSSKREIFKVKSGWVLDGNFYSAYNSIALKVNSNIDNLFDIKVFSKKNGNVSTEINGVSKVEFFSSELVVSKNSKVLEYVFK